MVAGTSPSLRNEKCRSVRRLRNHGETNATTTASLSRHGLGTGQVKELDNHRMTALRVNKRRERFQPRFAPHSEVFWDATIKSKGEKQAVTTKRSLIYPYLRRMAEKNTRK